MIGAGLVMLALSRSAPAVAPEEIAALRSRIETLQQRQTAADRKAAAPKRRPRPASAQRQRSGRRARQRRRRRPMPAPSPASTEQARRAEAAAAAVGQRLDQASARIGSVETLAQDGRRAEPAGPGRGPDRPGRAGPDARSPSGQPFAADVAALAKGGGAPEQIAALHAVATSRRADARRAAAAVARAIARCSPAS